MHSDRVFANGITVTGEKEADYPRIREIVTLAFAQEKEADLIEATRKTEGFDPDYSLVARYRGKAIGHLMLNKIKVVSPEQETAAVIIAPLTVDPAYQGIGAGSCLIRTAIERATADGMPFILVMGGTYYERFGFTAFAHQYGIFRPHPLLGKQKVRVMALREGGLDGVMGVIRYPDSFRSFVEVW